MKVNTDLKEHPRGEFAKPLEVVVLNRLYKKTCFYCITWVKTTRGCVKTMFWEKYYKSWFGSIFLSSKEIFQDNFNATKGIRLSLLNKMSELFYGVYHIKYANAFGYYFSDVALKELYWNHFQLGINLDYFPEN